MLLATLRGDADVQLGECNMAAATADLAHAQNHALACFVITPSIYISALNWDGEGG